MVAGRPQKPTAIKKLEGNPGRRELNEQEPKFPVAKTGFGDFLDDEARQEYERVAALLKPQGLLTEADKSVLCGYAIWYSRWAKAERALKTLSERDLKVFGLMIKGDRGRPVQNPLIRTAATAYDMMMKSAQEFGMTPVARAKVKANGEGEENKFDEFLNDPPIN